MASALPIYAPKATAGVVSTTLPRYSARRVDPSERAAGLPRYEPRDGSTGLPQYAPQSQAGFGGAGRDLPKYMPPSPLPDETHAEAAAGTVNNTAATDPSGAQTQPAPPSTGYAPSRYNQDASDLWDLYTTPPQNTNSRLGGAGRLAAYAAGREAQQTNSLGRVVGAAAGGLISGLVNKRADEAVIDRPAQIARVQSQVALDAAADKERNDAAEADARRRNLDADTAYKQSLPTYRSQQQELAAQKATQAKLLGAIKVAGHYRRGENPELDSQLDEAGLSVSDFDKNSDSFTWHEMGGQAFRMSRKTGETSYATVDGAPIQDRSKMPDPVTGLTPPQAQAAKDREADRQTRERIAASGIASRERIAAANQAIARDRQKMSAAQFAARYPGVGKPPITLSEIRQMAEQNNTLESEVVRQALSKGYQVEGFGQQ